jgi:hypothetical protein
MNANGMELTMVAAFWALVIVGPTLYLGYKELRRHMREVRIPQRSENERKAAKRTS